MMLQPKEVKNTGSLGNKQGPSNVLLVGSGCSPTWLGYVQIGWSRTGLSPSRRFRLGLRCYGQSHNARGYE
jgi:hypothetical protein